jgi:hypothetical protein
MRHGKSAIAQPFTILQLLEVMVGQTVVMSEVKANNAGIGQ